MGQRNRSRRAVQTAPFASFSGRTEKEGPARPERISISSSLIMNCAAGFADATSFSLLDAKRTKQEKHAWGSVPHDPRARHFGRGQLRGTLKPVRRKGFKLTAHGGSNRKPFRFPAARGNSLTSHAPSLAQCCLGLSLPDCGAMAFRLRKVAETLRCPPLTAR